MKNVQIHDRINTCIDIFEDNYTQDSFCDICPIKIKKYFNINQLIHNELVDDYFIVS